MITRHPHASLLLLVALTAALHAAPGIPPATEPKGVAPVTPAAANKSPDLPPPSIPAAKPAPATDSPPPSIPAAKSAPAASVPPATPAAREPVSTPVEAPANPPPSAEKPGVLSAAKAKGPPPVAKSPATAQLSPRFRQIRERISALFDTRNTPPAPPDPRTNPFRPAGALASAPLPAAEGAAPAPVADTTDLTALQQAVATLKVRGVLQIGGRMQLVINSGPGKEGTYKEGDIINVLLPPGDPVHLRVRQVSRYSVTLSLNDAEMTLKF